MKKADRIALVKRICRIASLSDPSNTGHFFTKKQLMELHLYLVELNEKIENLENKLIGGGRTGDGETKRSNTDI